MEAFHINKKSWHYRIAELAMSKFTPPTSLCEYLNCVIGGLLVVGGVALIALFIAYSMVDAMAWVAAMAMSRTSIPPTQFAQIGTAILLVAALMYLVLTIHFSKWPAPTGRAATIWRSVTKKACVPVKFE